MSKAYAVWSMVYHGLGKGASQEAIDEAVAKGQRKYYAMSMIKGVSMDNSFEENEALVKASAAKHQYDLNDPRTTVFFGVQPDKATAMLEKARLMAMDKNITPAAKAVNVETWKAKIAKAVEDEATPVQVEHLDVTETVEAVVATTPKKKKEKVAA